MGLTLLTPAVEEPVTRDMVKDHLRIHRDVTQFDQYLDQLATAARGYAETFLRRQLLPATWRLSLDRPPRYRDTELGFSAEIWLPRPPLIEIVRVRYRDGAGAWVDLASSDYVVCTNFEPGKIFPSEDLGGSWPECSLEPGSFEIDFKAGYADSSKVPSMICIGICEIARQLYDGVDLEKAMRGVHHLLYPYRVLDERTLNHA